MKDWAGNNIKVGDTVIEYMYMIPFSDCKTTINLDGNDMLFDPKPKYVWDEKNRFKVIEKSNEIGLSLNGDISEIPINLIGLFSEDWSVYVCKCIEGKSDNRDDFFINYFKVEGVKV